MWKELHELLQDVRRQLHLVLVVALFSGVFLAYVFRDTLPLQPVATTTTAGAGTAVTSMKATATAADALISSASSRAKKDAETVLTTTNTRKGNALTDKANKGGKKGQERKEETTTSHMDSTATHQSDIDNVCPTEPLQAWIQMQRRFANVQ